MLTVLRAKPGLFFCFLVGVGSLTFSAVQATWSPITYDEAYTYVMFAQRPCTDILSDYHVPNNHILHTLLVKAATLEFGNSEIVIRLPALLGGGILFLALSCIARSLASRVGVLWVVLVMLTPTVIEYNAYARGYSLGCGLSFSGLALLLALLPTGPAKSSEQPPNLTQRKETSSGTREDRRRCALERRSRSIRQLGIQAPGRAGKSAAWAWNRRAVLCLSAAGMLFGLAIGCVPVFGVIAVAACGAFLIVQSLPFSLRSVLGGVLGVAIVVVSATPIVAFCYWRIHADTSEWTWGFSSFGSFLHAYWGRTYHLSDGFGVIHAWVAGVGLALLTCLGLVRANRASNRSVQLLLLTLVITVFGLVVSHVVLGFKWPIARAVPFLIPLVVFALLYVPFDALARYKRPMWAVAAILPVAAALNVLGSVDPEVHHMWRNSSVVRKTLAIIDAREPERAQLTVSIPAELFQCIQYDLMRRPRPRLRFLARGPWGTKRGPVDPVDFAISWSRTDARRWRWKGDIVYEDPNSDSVLLAKRSES